MAEPLRAAIYMTRPDTEEESRAPGSLCGADNSSPGGWYHDILTTGWSPNDSTGQGPFCTGKGRWQIGLVPRVGQKEVPTCRAAWHSSRRPCTR